ncbi:MAG: helix-turn-helix domain-containing protein [Pseudomonadota bacterium]
MDRGNHLGAVNSTITAQPSSHGSAQSGDYTVRSRFYSPPPEFDGCFTTFYQLILDVDGPGTVEDYLQPEWGNIRFFAGSAPTAELGQSRVSGPRFSATGPSSLPCRFELGTSRMWGIGFLPLGWARFLDVDAYDCVNSVYDGAADPVFSRFDCMSDVLCDPDISEDDQFEAIVLNMRALMRPNRDEPKILRVHAAMVDEDLATVGELADASGMSVRTLERVCRRYFGFTPKLLMRRQRFMRSLTTFMLHQGQRGGKRWTEAMDEHYHDQAQFTREFHEFMTMNPSEYASLDHPILSSFVEARARVWGSAAQTLDKPSR